MTEISYISGMGIPNIPQNEMPDRGKGVKKSQYIPYLSMTKGEMALALLRDQAEVFAQHQPDNPVPLKAINMIDNALYGGIHNNKPITGVIPPPLQIIADRIDKASSFYLRQPAAGIFINRGSLQDGVMVGDTAIVNYTPTDCYAWAANLCNQVYHINLTWGDYHGYKAALFGPQRAKYQRWVEYVQTCQTNIDIQNILNDKMVDSAHHMTYKSISPDYPYIKGTDCATKRLLHLAGIGGYSDVTGVDQALVSQWVETGILRKNANSGIGTLDSITTGLSLAPNNTQIDQYLEWSGALKDEKLAKARMKTAGKVNGIGFVLTVATVTLIVAVIAGAVKIAAAVLDALQKKKAGAMAAANGFGSVAFMAQPSDFLGATSATKTVTTTPGGNTQPATNTQNPLLIPGLIVGGAIAAYLIMED